MKLNREVIVNLRTDKAFRGVLWMKRRAFIVLKGATLLEHGTSHAVDGEFIIQRDNIDFVQAL